MKPPPVRYTSIDGEHIAYQVVGDSDLVGLSLTSWTAAIDGVWEDPEHLRIWRTILGAGGCAIHLDHRGLGSSDPVPADRIADLDDWVDDVVAVLDAVGVERCPILAEADQTAVGLRLAARHPDRVERLVLPHALLRMPWSVEDAVGRAEEHWGTGRFVEWLGRPGDLDYLARSERRAASRGAAIGVLRNIDRWDVTPDLPNVDVPCLVMKVVGSRAPEQAAQIADALPNAELVEVHPTGNYWGDRMFERILEWIGWQPATGERQLASLLMTDVVGSTERLASDGDAGWRDTLDVLDEVVTGRAELRGGRVLKHTGDGHLLSFPRPGDAVDAARAIIDGAARLGVRLRAGVHTGEIELRDNDEVSGMTVHLVARIAGQAEGGQVLVSRTVADLITGTGRNLLDRGEHELKGVPGEWRLYEVAAG